MVVRVPFSLYLLSPFIYIDFSYSAKIISDHYLRNRPPTKDLEEAGGLFTIRFPSAEKPFIENYAIILKDDNGNSDVVGDGETRGKMIGSIGIPRLSHDGVASEVGYGITPEFWGKGYASEALVMFVRLYFNSKS